MTAFASKTLDANGWSPLCSLTPWGTDLNVVIVRSPARQFVNLVWQKADIGSHKLPVRRFTTLPSPVPPELHV